MDWLMGGYEEKEQETYTKRHVNRIHNQQISFAELIIAQQFYTRTSKYWIPNSVSGIVHLDDDVASRVGSNEA
jgi:hypothetical protein